MTCTCTDKVLSVPAPCPVHWPDGVVRLIEAGAAKANAKGVPMLSREQFEAVERVVNKVRQLDGTPDPVFDRGWVAALGAALDAIRSELVLKVEVAPAATATGTIEGLDGLGRRVGQG